MLTIIEALLDTDAAAEFRDRLAASAWADGAGTAGSRSVSVKQNEQLDRADPLALELGNRILAALGRNPRFVSASLAERIWPPVFNCYRGGGHYGVHSDAALMRLADGGTLRSDLSATLFLSDPADYDGGELLIEGGSGATAIKLSAGDMVLYPSSSLHQVTPVTRGERVCAITWIQSAVVDAAARELLFDLDQTIQALTPTRSHDDPEINRLVNIYHNLLRRWARP